MSADDDFPRVVALHDYTGRSSTELSFRKGDILIISDMLDDAWYMGELGGAKGCIPSAYVKHAKNWRELTQQQPIGGPKSQSQRSAAPNPKGLGPHGAPPPLPATASPRGSPMSQRRNPVSAAAAAAASPGSPKLGRFQMMGGAPLPGMVKASEMAPGAFVPSGATRAFGPGASEDELIAPKPVMMQPDRPDLAKALNVRNQAARVAGPTKKATTANDLANHLSQMKMKQAQKQIDDKLHTSELERAMRFQSVKVAEKTAAADAEASMSTFDRKMAARRAGQAPALPAHLPK